MSSELVFLLFAAALLIYFISKGVSSRSDRLEEVRVKNERSIKARNLRIKEVENFWSSWPQSKLKKFGIDIELDEYHDQFFIPTKSMQKHCKSFNSDERSEFVALVFDRFNVVRPRSFCSFDAGKQFLKHALKNGGHCGCGECYPVCPCTDCGKYRRKIRFAKLKQPKVTVHCDDGYSSPGRPVG